MLSSDYLKKFFGAIIAAMVIIPGIAMGFYVTYQIVTALGN